MTFFWTLNEGDLKQQPLFQYTLFLQCQYRFWFGRDSREVEREREKSVCVCCWTVVKGS